jgi:hypothetical protein|tara:strand:- start:488 stop:664 length:177 start_codon:yes stop_codon:yes gene_type:complete
MNHFANNGKEYLRKEDTVNTQGRSPRQVESNYRVAEWTFVGGIVLAIVYLTGSILGQW